MRKLKPQEIIKAVPDVQTVVLPQDWFDNLNQNSQRSVFNSLYDWMLKNKLIPPDADDKNDICNKTYVGEKIYKQLWVAERDRIKKRYKKKGDELEKAVAWSDVNTGPQTEIDGLKICGDSIFVIPESSRDALEELAFCINEEDRLITIKKIRSQAAGADFRQWLLPQIERPDRVGDIARDVESDPGFPQEINRYEDLEYHLRLQGACEAAIDSVKEAWLEYIQQYPERIKPCALCDECGTSINIDEAFAVWNPDFSLMVLDSDCLEGLNNLSEQTKSWDLQNITKSDFIDFVEVNMKDFDTQNEDILEEWEKLEEKLKLWGFAPSPPIEKSGCVYFIQSQGTHTIKIGYTAGQAQNRLKALQTAHPYQLNILATLPGDQNYEKLLHQRFAEYRLKGEWFEPHPDLLAFISLLNKNET
jgi:uncharacterized protein YozE (UPF0346 family)